MGEKIIKKSPIKNDDEFIECPECGASVKSKNISSHLAKIHFKITEDYKKITEKNKKIEKKDRISRRTVKTNYINKKRKKSILYFGALFIIIAVIIAGYFYFENYGQSKEGLEIKEIKGIIGEAASQNPAGNKKTAPDFTLQDATGTNISLHNFKGKVVILHFMQILTDCHGTYFYKSDDKAPYNSAYNGYVSLTSITTVNQFEELRNVYNNYSTNDVAIISIIIPPGCCGDPLKFSKDIKNQFNLEWYVASDTMKYDTWYNYLDYLPYDSKQTLTRDPTILVLDKDQHIVYESGYTNTVSLCGV